MANAENSLISAFEFLFMSKIAAALKSAPDDITVFKSANSTHMQKFLVPIKRASTVRHQLREFSEKMKE